MRPFVQRIFAIDLLPPIVGLVLIIALAAVL